MQQLPLASQSRLVSIGETNSKKPKSLNKITSDTMSLVERRLNYASGVGLSNAFKHSYGTEDDTLDILATYHDLSEAAVFCQVI